MAAGFRLTDSSFVHHEDGMTFSTLEIRGRVYVQDIQGLQS